VGVFKVPAREKNELLSALGGMKKDIVASPRMGSAYRVHAVRWCRGRATGRGFAVC